MKKRILSILLVCCMVLTLLPATAFAAEVETGARASNPGGLCEHHPEHDEACGYTEGTAEIPCSHEHTEECHSLITRCVHAHTAECYTAESVSENADGYRRQRTQHDGMRSRVHRGKRLYPSNIRLQARA